MQQKLIGRATTLAAATMATAASCGASSSPSFSTYQQRISSLAASIQPRVLVSSRGSGNHGESGSADFYTIDHTSLPLALRDMPSSFPRASTSTSNDHECTTTTSPSKPLERVDLELGPSRLAFYIDDVLTHDEADALAACAEAILEQNGHSRFAPGIHTPPGMRVNEAAHWYPTATSSSSTSSSSSSSSLFLGPILDRVQHLVPQELGGMPLHPRLSEKVAQFKYLPGDRFNRHVDGLFPGQGANEEGTGVIEWKGVVSGMSMLFYLNDGPNDGLKGGETRLWSSNGKDHVDVTPRKGRVLFFRRGSPDAVLHAGMPVMAGEREGEEGGGTPKYMALINLAYGNQTGTRPMMP